MSNRLKWLFAACLLIAGVVGNYYYQDTSVLARVVLLLILASVALWVAAKTTSGEEALTFIKGARLELQKVVWPTRQETIQSTLVVMAMVAVMGLLLWGFDALLLRVVAWLTGYKVA